MSASSMSGRPWPPTRILRIALRLTAPALILFGPIAAASWRVHRTGVAGVAGENDRREFGARTSHAGVRPSIDFCRRARAARTS